jgi:hypothetical protein
MEGQTDKGKNITDTLDIAEVLSNKVRIIFRFILIPTMFESTYANNVAISHNNVSLLVKYY